jgi:imidazolonepropionase
MALRKSTSSSLLVVQGIGELYTLAGVAKKKARQIRADDLGCIKNASLVIRDGRVVFAGDAKKMPRLERRDRARAHDVDLHGAGVLPAFVEAHTHLLFAGNRAGEFERRNQGETYQSIAASGGGILSTVRATRALSPAALARLAQPRVERFLRQGVTTLEVKSGYGLTVDSELNMLRAAKKLKKARVIPTFLGAHAVPIEHKGNPEAWVTELIEKALPVIEKENLARRVDIFIENGYFTCEQGRRLLKAAQKRKLDLTIHADQLSRSGGARLAVELGAHSADHLLCVDKSDIQKLGRSEVTAVLLPSADLYMNCPYPPARQLIDAGARVALATDFNPGSAPSQDLSLVGVLARVLMKMSLAEVIAAYTVGAAHALGLDSDLGSLTPGKFGDFIVLEAGLDDLFLEIGRQPIDQVYREGVRLV